MDGGGACMTRRTVGSYPVLPLDLGDAAGVFAFVAGALAVTAPFFLGLTAALSLLLLAAGLVRRWGPDGDPPARVRPRRLDAAILIASVGWAFFFVHPGPAAFLAGPALAVADVPLWLVIRRPVPFGG